MSLIPPKQNKINDILKYFSIGKISEDQLTDYCDRKKMHSDEVRRFISPYLRESNQFEPELV